MEMIQIAWIWVFTSIIFFAIGYSLKNIVTESSQIDLFDDFWIGWGAVIFLLILANFFIPIDKNFFFLIAYLGAFCLSIHIKKIYLFLKNYISTQKFQIFIFISAIFLVAYGTMAEKLPYDAGLYHMQSVKWASTYPVIPGLGNLHGRLAFNSSYFLYFAFFSFSPITYYKLGSGLILAVILSKAMCSFLKVLRNSTSKISFDEIMWCLFICPLLYQAYRFSATTSPDLPIFLIGIIIAINLSKLIFRDLNTDETLNTLFIIILLSTIGITIKLSSIVLGAACIFLATLIVFFPNLVLNSEISSENLNKTALNKKFKNYLLIYLVCFLIGTAYMVRGLILSGYPLYPSTFTFLKADWQIPYQKVVDMAGHVKSWAQLQQLGKITGWYWLIPWGNRMLHNVFNRFDLIFPVLITAVTTIIFLFRSYTPSDKRKLDLLVLPSLLNVIFWFIQAPEPRFAGSTFFIIAIALVSFFIFNSLVHKQRIYTAVINFCWMIFLLSTLTTMTKELMQGEKDFRLTQKSVIKQEMTNSGLTIFLPLDGYHNEQCWDAPLPCTPNFNKDLHLRDKNNILKGFSVL
ncbi:MAG: hypothetical protein KBD53_05505 [Candidatus Omnitrophica bacterium]|nr:hypothetical protein [Candidatus Omnitrophota bacterium]